MLLTSLSKLHIALLIRLFESGWQNEDARNIFIEVIWEDTYSKISALLSDVSSAHILSKSTKPHQPSLNHRANCKSREHPHQQERLLVQGNHPAELCWNSLVQLVPSKSQQSRSQRSTRRQDSWHQYFARRSPSCCEVAMSYVQYSTKYFLIDSAQAWRWFSG